jgi:hypothetical protein
MSKLYKDDKIQILINDSWGIYIPQRFTENFPAELWGIDPESDDWKTIAAGPEAENYWEAWDSILDKAKHVESETGNCPGVVWTLYQNGDLWAVAYDEMTEPEREEFFAPW